MHRSPWIVLAFCCVSCATNQVEVDPATGQEGFTINGASSSSANGPSGKTNNGTKLGVTGANGSVSCVDSLVPLSSNGSISTTGSVDSVVISAIVDNGDEREVGLIQPQDFVHDGRNKTAPFDVIVSLAPGTHSFQLCFTQSGAQGRTSKRTCGETTTVAATCEEEG